MNIRGLINMEKYLITFNDTEVVTCTQTDGGGTIVTGTNAIISTLDMAIPALQSIGIDCTIVVAEKNKKF